MTTWNQVDSQNTVTTANATPVVCVEVESPSGSTGTVLVMVAARRRSNGDSKCWSRVYGYKRATDGTLSVLGSINDQLATSADSGASTWAISFTASGGRIQMSVTGQAGATIDWYGSVEGMAIQT